MRRIATAGGPLSEGRRRAAAEAEGARSPTATLRKYEGYYHDANPRNQAFAFVEWLLSGRAITRRAAIA